MLNKFYEDNVKLSNSDVNNLRELREKNERRLATGLQNLGYPRYDKIIEQGSISMNTAIKNLDNEYDIDLAVIFNSSDLSPAISAETIKNYILKALTKNDVPFKKDPEIRTNAVTLWYSDGYHVDFAIYKYDAKNFQHAGKEWTDRNPSNINDWFSLAVKKYSFLKETIQLIKYIVKLDSNELKISGLMLTVLVVEFFEKSNIQNSSLENCFLKSIKYIYERLLSNIEIFNPDNNINLNNSDKDITRINNFIKILKTTVFYIDIIYDYNILFNQIFKTNFFNHDINLNVKIRGKNGLKSVYNDGMICYKNNEIFFELKTNIYFDKVKWEVINTGEEARLAECLTHFVEDDNKDTLSHRLRRAAYKGTHRMVCYLYLNGTLIKKIERKIIID